MRIFLAFELDFFVVEELIPILNLKDFMIYKCLLKIYIIYYVEKKRIIKFYYKKLKNPLVQDRGRFVFLFSIKFAHFYDTERVNTILYKLQ